MEKLRKIGTIPKHMQNKSRKKFLMSGIIASILICTLLWMATSTEAQTEIINMVAGETLTISCDGTQLNGEIENPTLVHIVCEGISPTNTPPPNPTSTAIPPTPAVTPTPPPGGSIEPYPGAPACDEALHDANAWHGLWNYEAGCHYDHEHKHDPHEVDDIFGEPGAWFAGDEISYPWQTFVGANGNYPQWSGDPAELENVAKHKVYGWIVRRDIPANGRSVWIKAFRLQYHAMSAPAGTLTRYHSFSLEAQVCDNSHCGIVRTGGWIDFGNLEVNGYGIVPLAGQEDAYGDAGRRRIHYFYADPESRRQAQAKAEFFWYGRQRPLNPPYNTVPLHPLSIALATGDAWSNVDPLDPTAMNLFCPAYDCNKNGSTIQAHVVQFNITQANFNGYVDRYGKRANGCTEPGLDCIPLIIENAPLGLVQHRDDTHLGLPSAGAQDFDISPPGEWWIEFPN
ncbi:MAG: hypothetical protein KC413_09090 [Anaerolineales bacterium]|nr:hypothetical protein [Anaerolineales bacterium]